MSRSDKHLESIFLEEAKKRLESLHAGIQNSRQKGSLDPEIALALHTLKGSARMLGLLPLVDFLHGFEEELKTIDPSKDSACGLLEARYHELADRLQELDVDSAQEVKHEHLETNPATLAQRLLASVTKLEILQTELRSQLSDQSRKLDSTEKLKLEFALDKEIKMLKQHSHKLAVGHSEAIFVGMNELAQRIANEEKKKIQLTWHSSRPKILRSYISELRGALIHIISNAVVHGIELPEVRKSKGKPSAGRIDITFSQTGQNLCLKVSDDGGGVDLTRLKATESRVKKQNISEEESVELLFEPGISLADTLSTNAGRGVGLAAVKQVVEKYHGNVLLSPLTEGTEIVLKLPCPWFLEQCLLVESQGVSFAILGDELDSVESEPSASIPSLAEAAGFPSSGKQEERVVLRSKRGEDKWSVHSCKGISERLIYPLPQQIDTNQGIIGLAEYGWRRVLTIDLSVLTSSLSKRPRDAVKALREDLTLVLVVDDSVTTRSIVSDVLRRSGFAVIEAIDGVEALEKLKADDFSLVVSDLEMPNMDGLEFLQTVRASDSSFQNVPFVLFTSRDDTASFEKAYLLGADRCVGKSNFVEHEFVRTVKELL